MDAHHYSALIIYTHTLDYKDKFYITNFSMANKDKCYKTDFLIGKDNFPSLPGLNTNQDILNNMLFQIMRVLVQGNSQPLIQFHTQKCIKAGDVAQLVKSLLLSSSSSC